jgi:hypothetical protein
MAADGSFADPGVRIHDLITAFGANGIATSICDANFGPALQLVAGRIGTLLAAGGGTGGPPGSIPNCAVTGIGGQGGTGGGAGAGGSTAGSGGSTPANDAGSGTPPVDSGCACRAGGAGAGGGALGFVLACAVSGLLARRRGGRASGRPSRGRCTRPSRPRAPA